MIEKHSVFNFLSGRAGVDAVLGSPKCTFPSMTATNGRSGHHYSEGSIGQSRDAALRRAGIRHRKAYQSRHTYACWSLAAGANPNFIAQQMGHASARWFTKFMAHGWQKTTIIRSTCEPEIKVLCPTTPLTNDIFLLNQCHHPFTPAYS